MSTGGETESVTPEHGATAIMTGIIGALREAAAGTVAAMLPPFLLLPPSLK